MKYEVKITKTLKSDNGKWFSIGNDIAFTVPNLETNYLDRYIGEIKDIKEDSFVVWKVEINRKHVDGEIEVLYEDIIRNSCNYVSVD